MKLIDILIFLILCSGLFFYQPVIAEDMMDSSSSTEASGSHKLLSPRIVTVKFHADWCPESNQMGDIMTGLQNSFDGKPVFFITFDRTNISSCNRTELLASALGLGEIYKRYQGTGFIILIDWNSK